MADGDLEPDVMGKVLDGILGVDRPRTRTEQLGESGGLDGWSEVCAGRRKHTEASATATAAEYQAGSVPLAAYECPFDDDDGAHWHLGSASMAEAAAAINRRQ